MRGAVTIMVCLALLWTSVAPAFAAGRLLHAHAPAVTELASASSPSAHGRHDARSATTEREADRLFEGSDMCLGGEGIHCGAALAAPERIEALLRLSRQTGVRLSGYAADAQRAPEMEAPPPRV